MDVRGIICCNNPNLIPKGGYVCCVNCGTCVDRDVVALEPRVFEGDKDLVDHHISDHYARCVISVSDLRKNPRFYSLNKTNYWYSKESRFYNHHKSFKAIVSKAKIPRHVANEALEIFKGMWNMKLFRNHDTTAIALATIYYASEIHSFPMTVQYLTTDEFWPSLKGGPADKRASPLMSKLTAALALTRNFLGNKRLHKAEVKDLIPKVGNELKLPQNIIVDAVLLYKDARSKGFDPSGKTRLAIAGASIYICASYAGAKVLQASVCKVAQTTEITLRSRITELLETSTIDAAIHYKHAAKSRNHLAKQIIPIVTGLKTPFIAKEIVSFITELPPPEKVSKQQESAPFLFGNKASL